MTAIKKVKTKPLTLIALLIYVTTVLWFTVFSRPISLQTAQLELFWSYRKWLAGDWKLGWEIIANIVMFVPFGFLLPRLLIRKIQPTSSAPEPSRLWIIHLFPVTVCAILFSLTIETLQLVLMRGLFEWDDLISNTCGALAGWGLYQCFKRLQMVTSVISASFIIACIGVFAVGKNVVDTEADITPRIFCFQIDTIERHDNRIGLTGFAFRYEHRTSDFTIILRSTETGKKIRLATEQIARPDVNDYFLCGYDYTASGFTAAAGDISTTEEYEVMVQWPWSILLATGVFIKDSTIYYMPEKKFSAPEGGRDLQEIVENGTVRVYRPDYHCWVYQLDSALYWIADPDLVFEDDSKTYIQYQLWTTQTENLPQHRLKNDWLWDNIGGYFEDYELHGDFGSYRVMKRELPDEYSIISIVTGYYKNEKWIWKNYFRPIYEFQQ